MPSKVKIDNLSLSESGYIKNNGDRWSVSTLIQYCKEQKYPVFKLPLAAIPLNCLPFDVNNIDDLIWHMKRVRSADLQYPIILDDYGTVCDGYHRICKAILNGATEIDAIRIETMPATDGHDTTE